MKEIIQKTIEDLLSAMGFAGDVYPNEEQEGLRINIETEDASFLIGQAGANLICLQQLVKKIVEKKNENRDKQFISFILDINNYRKHKIEILRDLASSTAEKVLSEKRAVILPSMNAFERKVIHTSLTNYQNILTESQGEEPNRRIIIKLQNII